MNLSHLCISIASLMDGRSSQCKPTDTWLLGKQLTAICHKPEEGGHILMILPCPKISDSVNLEESFVLLQIYMSSCGEFKEDRDKTQKARGKQGGQKTVIMGDIQVIVLCLLEGRE